MTDEEELRNVAEKARELARRIEIRPQDSAMGPGGTQVRVNSMLPRPTRGTELRDALMRLGSLIDNYLRP